MLKCTMVVSEKNMRKTSVAHVAKCDVGGLDVTQSLPQISEVVNHGELIKPDRSAFELELKLAGILLGCLQKRTRQ